MQSTKTLSLVRTITTFTSKCTSIVSPTTCLRLDSYCDPDSQLSTYSQNRSIDDLIKSGNLNSAHHLFEEMPLRDVVTYNLLISGHGKYGQSKRALLLYNEMVSYGIKESASTFSSVLSICTDAGFCIEGTQVHCRVVSLGFGSNLYIGSSLVGLYMRMRLDVNALKLFDELPERNLPTWNLMLRGFCELGRSDELLRLYAKMKFDGVDPNELSFCYLFSGCSNAMFVNEGKQLHCHVIKLGWVDTGVFLANALVDFYSACGSLTDATKSFEAIPVGDVISWNSVVLVYAKHGLVFDALELFSRMQLWGKRPAIRSLVGFLNLSSRTSDISFGKQIHCCVLKMGFDHASVHVQSALTDMYGKCNEIESSVVVFKTVPERSLECCNSLMTSLLHCGVVEDVVETFGFMVDEGLGFDEVALSSTLKALSMSDFTNLDSCRSLHCCAVKSGFEYDVAVSCSLIDAYSRCGHVELSRKVFEKLHSPNEISFTSIINGYARNGMGREGLDMLGAMIQKGLTPDKVTFLCVLNGCNHSGMVKEGQMVFNSMKSVYGIDPDQRHYSCMVDLLGRAGLLKEAEELLQQTPGKGDCAMWSSLLRSCMVHGNEILGRRVAKSLMDLEPNDFAVYLQVSNFYADLGEYERSMQIRDIASARKMTRETGHSLIELNSSHQN
ncbi:hypothetical protein LWI29_023116 [Acer saccharum]|uniref:Pentatricopeptide repeat-containing protein n=1 Tax=Acer saccharum TaxID=4024 RepID=A0AA39UVE1_ACESA|nr:hypothetical protein LWI29_023116 [Acer saccharum]